MRYSERILDSSRPGKYFLVFVFFFLLFALSAIGQEKEEKKLRLQAVKSLNDRRFADAQQLYTDLLQLSPDNPDYNYEMGLAIYEEGLKRGKSAQYFEKAIQYTKSDTLAEMFLFAGKAEQYGGNFDLAIEYFTEYLSLKRKEGLSVEELEDDVPRYIEMCQNGKVQFENNKTYIQIENLGPEINSPFPDYSPVVNNDETIVLFTSRRDDSNGGEKDVDDKFFEDIYFSLNVDGNFTKATNLDSTNRIINDQVNTPLHDATITYANNETELYIYRDQDVWVSRLENGLWTIPIKDAGRINSAKGFEPSVFITQDEKTMFVVSDLSTGYGGRDIYVTTKDEEGNWRSLKNLGKGINTKHEEDAPFLTPDGNTLYFASKGHNSMGDYDIFKTELSENGEWGPPQNLGAPINTPGHDRYFVTTDNGAVGYYASDRDGGLGETDLYRIVLDCKAVSATKIRGTVFSEERGGPIATTITIFDPATLTIFNTYKSDARTGKYEMRLKTEKTYGFKIEAEGYLPHSGEFTVPKQCDYYSLFQEIKIENLEDEQGRVYAQRAVINNAFFDVDQKIEEDFSDVRPNELTEDKKDSLRSIIAANYNPMEMTNYVSYIEILDPEGIRLGLEKIGDMNAGVQVRDMVSATYNNKIVEADRYFYNNQLPEARANYMMASAIRPEENYPRDQVRIIQEKLKDAPYPAFLSSLPEEDKAKLRNLDLKDSAGVAPLVVAAAEPMPAAKTPEPAAPAKPAPTPEPAKPVVVEQPKPAETPAVAASETIVFRNILFDFDRSNLRPESVEELTKIQKYLTQKQSTELQIDGHADWIGSVDYNLALSERRAKAAHSYLLNAGINGDRLTYKFFGEAVPIAPNQNADGSDNPQGRQLNRRCEFKLDATGVAENVVMKF